MRVIGSKIYKDCSITFYNWNNRYLIKVESGPYEETFKVPEYDLSSEDELNKIVNDEFIDECIERFNAMDVSLRKSIERF